MFQRSEVNEDAQCRINAAHVFAAETPDSC
jgi:hypothetical protein